MSQPQFFFIFAPCEILQQFTQHRGCHAKPLRLGKWGLMRKLYLRIAQPFLFSEMVLSETLRLLAVAFVVFIIPHIAEWLIIRIAVINYGLRDFIKS